MVVQQFGALVSNGAKLKKHLLLVTLAALSFSLIALFFFDQNLSLYFNVPEIRAAYWQTARDITHIALSEYYFALALGSWALCAFVAPKIKVLKSQSQTIDFFRRWGLNFFVALLICGVMTHAIKFLSGRQRPHKSPDFDPMVFDPITTHWHWHSFSSGHSQVIFTAATMMTLAFPKLRYAWFLFATSICLTRVIIHDHFLSDIIMGACVGYVGTLLSLRLMQLKSKNGMY